ncbi:helix-turn-helix domain-containing protein [Lacipirellula sp.]|uniref:helix-turn-helix domain-containing protein n=1 Tax=Lacipirellula sp. TaxID=2691419 RepID=UPI003D0B0AAA
MSVAQAAGLLGVSKETVYKLCAEGDLSHNRIGTRITITPDQLAEYRQLQAR